MEILRCDVYRGFGPTLADIQAGRETVRTWMIESKLWRASRQSVDKIHQWRPRRARFVLHDSTEENMRGRPVSYYTDKAGLFQTVPKSARYATDLPRDEREPLSPTQIGRQRPSDGSRPVAPQ